MTFVQKAQRILMTEGCNGRLPNQDLLNSFQNIAKYTGGVPVVLYDHLDRRAIPRNRDEIDIVPEWVPTIIRDLNDVREYCHFAKNVLRHVGYQARGKPSGVHGLFHQYGQYLHFTPQRRLSH